VKVQKSLIFLWITILLPVYACADTGKKTIKTRKFEYSVPSSWKQGSGPSPDCTVFMNPLMKDQSFALMVCTTSKSVYDILAENNYIKFGDKLLRAGYTRFSIAPVNVRSNYVSVSSRTICGITDEAGFHAAGGMCYTLIAFGNNFSVIFDTDGTEQNDKEVKGIFNSLKIKIKGDSGLILNKIKAIPSSEDLEYPFSIEAWESETNVSPSFNCSQARTKVEKTLCANKDLAALDVTLAENYDKARRATKGEKHRQLLDTQRAWLKQRNACEIAQCLTDAYTRRIKELCEQYPESACPPDNQ
jgi:uncharacterized protein YecT (DUF1311 family)